jgi:hypothetical protein
MKPLGLSFKQIRLEVVQWVNIKEKIFLRQSTFPINWQWIIRVADYSMAIFYLFN